MFKRLFITLIMSCALLGLFGQSKQEFRSVDVKEFAATMADTTYIVLDVRTPAEYAEGHIPGTDLNIDVRNSNFTQEALAKLPKEKPVALYCRSGNRSKTAAKILAQNGYKIVELGSGILGWAEAGMAVEK
jgi:rhodanese-related sulfurtransferase